MNYFTFTEIAGAVSDWFNVLYSNALFAISIPVAGFVLVKIQQIFTENNGRL